MRVKHVVLLLLSILLLVGCDGRNYAPVEYFDGEVVVQWRAEGLGSSTRHFLEVHLRGEGEYQLRFTYGGIADVERLPYPQQVEARVDGPRLVVLRYQMELPWWVNIEIEHDGEIEDHGF